MKYGAIDIGTNAARLLIGEVLYDADRSFVKKISYTRIPLRLGDDVFSMGKVSAKKKLNLINTMKAFQIMTNIFEVSQVQAFATSAMREAANAGQIVLDIKGATGIDLKIISGTEEANVILNSIMLFDLDPVFPMVIIDVGGGSTEINIFKDRENVVSKSFKVGALRILRGKFSEAVWSEMNEWIASYIVPGEEYALFGIGGNIKKAYKLLVHGANKAAAYEELIKLKRQLESLTLPERMEKFQLRPDRADVIVPALDIYTRVISNFKCNFIHVPKVSLSDGMVYQMYLKEKNK